jgi:glycosyl transferase family 25
MKVHLINLDRSPERLAWFQRQSARLGLDLVRLPAVDAQHLEEGEIARLRDLSSRRNPLSAGEIACFLSHRKIWQTVAGGTEDWVFVAEDDIHFAQDAGAFLKATGWIPATALLIKAETNLRRQELSHAVLGRPFGHELRELRSNHFCSGGYFLSREGASRLLAFSARRCEPVDVILFSPELGILREMPVLQLSPAICVQDMFLTGRAAGAALKSLIEAPRADRRNWEKQTIGPRGASKLSREANRIAGQAAEALRRTLSVVGRRSVFRKIPITIDGTGE